MKLSNLYKSILRFSGLDADEDGYISTVIDDRREPAVIDGVRMVLPTANNLRSGGGNEKIIFHPLSENILRGESEIIKKLLEVINIRLNFTFGIIGQSLLNLVASPDLHKRLNPEQLELLIAIKDVDDVTLNNFISVMISGIKTRPDKLFTNIYLKRGGTVGSKRYSRAGIVTFPLYDELMSSTDTCFGTKIRQRDKDTFKQLYRFIFTNIGEPHGYDRGSDSSVAPYLDVLMKTSIGLAARFNDIILGFSDFIDESDSLVFDSDWVADFENLDALIPEIRRIPVQHGNAGAIRVDEKEATASGRQVVRPELPHEQPVASLALPPGKAPVATIPPWQAQPQQPPYQQPSTEIVKTNRGLDFDSLKTNMPQMAYLQNPLMPHLMQQQMMAGGYPPPPPAWAIGQPPQYPQQPPPGWAPQYQQQPPPGWAPQMPQYPMPQQPPPGWPPQMPQYPMPAPYPQPPMQPQFDQWRPSR